MLELSNYHSGGLKNLIIAGLMFPVLLMGASATVSWNPNQESDLAGYQVHYGTSPSTYSMIVDVGEVNEYEVKNLTIGQTYYFAVSAYDNSGNVSELSVEVPYTAQDGIPPTISSVRLLDPDRLKVIFSEPVDEVSAEQVGNYQINNGIVIQRAELQPDQISIVLYTIQHANGSYILTVNNVTDRAAIPNVIAANTTMSYTWDQSDEIKPTVTSVELVGLDHVQVNFSEPVDQNSAKTLANYQISGINILSASLTDNFMSSILTTSAHTPGSSYSISISGIEDAAANVMNPVTKTYTAPSSNTDPPRLISVKAISSTEVEVQFSEPVSASTAQNKNNYNIQPGITVLGAILAASKTVVNLSTSAHSNGSYTLTVSGVQDEGLPPLTMNGAQLPYTYVPPDNIKPQVVSVEISNSTLLTIKFDELIDQGSASNLSNYSISPSVTIQNAAMDNTGMNVLLITAEHPMGEFTLSISGVKDLAQNLMNTTSRTYSYTPPDRTPPILTGANIEGSTFVELIFNEELDRSSAQTVANYTISPAVSVTQADLVNGNRVYLKTATHQSGQNYTITVNGVRDKALNAIQAGSNTATYTAPVVDNTPPVLSAAEALGAKMIELTFSESMDETSACQTSNYTITGITVLEASLDLSKRTVYLKTSEHQPGAQYTVEVQNVKDLAGNPVATIQSKTYTLPAQDTQPPIVRDVDLISDKILLITFNEPVDATTAEQTGNYQVDGGITVQKVTLSSGNMEVWLETSVHQRGSYHVTVSNVKDQMNNAITSTSVSYDYSPADNDPPKLINVFVPSPYTLELWFDEVLEPVSAEGIANYSVENSVDHTQLTVTKATLDRTCKVVTLITSEHVPGNYSVSVTGVKDGTSGNESGTLAMAYAYSSTDNTPPVVESVFMNNSTQMVVQFNENLEISSASQKGNYTINNGITVKSVFVSHEGDVILETSEHAAGEYILTLNGIQDASNNTIQAYTQIKYQWNPNDTIPPELIAAALFSNNYLELSFSEPVNANDAESISNYTVEPYVAIQKATLSAKSPDKVFLFTDIHMPGTYQIKVNNVRDRAFVPNVIEANNIKTYVYTTPDTQPPKIVTVEAKSPYTVYIHFDESISMEEAQNKTNYHITPNIQVNQASLLDNRRTVLLETSIHDGGITYTVEVRNIKDRAPVPNALSSPITATYSYVPVDVVKPVLMSAKLMRSDYLELIFSEPVEKSSAETRSNYQIVPGVEIANAMLDLETQKKVYLETSMHLPGFTYTINIRNVRDLAPVPNVIDQYTSRSYTLTTTSASDLPPEVVRIEPLSISQIDIVFNKPIDKATAENKDNYIINSGTIAVNAAIIDTNLVRVHLTTAAHTMNQNYQIQVKNIKDRSATPKLMAASPSIPYIISKGLSLSGISRSDYEFGIFESGMQSYTDRDYTIVQAPEYLNGSVRVMTANDDKSGTGAYFLSFEIKGGAKCLVAYDTRIDSIPSWLSDWEATGDKIVDSRDNVFQLYQNFLPEGKAIFGGNEGSMDDAMYMIFAIPQKASGTLVNSLNKSNYQLAYLNPGDLMYIDRDYTIASIPASMNGVLWLKTANDDKTSKDSEFLTFNVTDSTLVFVAYDAQISEIPVWLTMWDSGSGEIVDSRGNSYHLYSKSYSTGQVTLGGNEGSMDDNMYLVALQSLGAENQWSHMPGYFTLNQNYPNPFNPITNIRYAVHKPGLVTLAVYNVLGQRVRVLVNQELVPGEYSEQWDATDDRGLAVSTGIYFYRIQMGDFAKTKRMMLVR
jgi:hypothetical protein